MLIFKNHLLPPGDRPRAGSYKSPAALANEQLQEASSGARYPVVGGARPYDLTSCNHWGEPAPRSSARLRLARAGGFCSTDVREFALPLEGTSTADADYDRAVSALVERGQWREAIHVARDWADLLRAAGRDERAFTVLEQATSFGQRVGGETPTIAQ